MTVLDVGDQVSDVLQDNIATFESLLRVQKEQQRLFDSLKYSLF